MSRSEHRQAVAAEVRAAVARKQIRLEVLSQQTGLARATLSNKLNGKSDFYVAELIDIALALDVEATSLLPVVAEQAAS